MAAGSRAIGRDWKETDREREFVWKQLIVVDGAAVLAVACSDDDDNGTDRARRRLSATRKMPWTPPSQTWTEINGVAEGTDALTRRSPTSSQRLTS